MVATMASARDSSHCCSGSYSRRAIRCLTTSLCQCTTSLAGVGWCQRASAASGSGMCTWIRSLPCCSSRRRPSSAGATEVASTLPHEPARVTR